MVIFVIFSIFDKEGAFYPHVVGGEEGGDMVLFELVTTSRLRACCASSADGYVERDTTACARSSRCRGRARIRHPIGRRWFSAARPVVRAHAAQ